MKRSLPIFISLLLLSGCATTGSNYYNYEGSGDYYTGASAADAVISSSPYGYGWAGSRFGAGVGYGFGYGLGGYGYGGGYGLGFGGPYSYWGYGYQPIWLIPSHPHQDSTRSRDARVERGRAARAGLVRRDTVQAPASAKGQFARQPDRARSFAPALRRHSAVESRTSPRVMSNTRKADPVRGRSFRSSPPPVNRSAPPTAPMRSAPPPPPSRQSSRRD